MSLTEPVSRRLVPVIGLPARPSRHRVAVWRELRRIGALPLGQGIRAVPDVPVFAGGIARAAALTEQAEGQVVTSNTSGRGPEDAVRLRETFRAARSADWTEFPADCGTVEERLPRRRRGMTARDVLGAREAAEAGERLKQCVAVREDHAEPAAPHPAPEARR